MLLRGDRESSWKLDKVKILGLEEHPAIEKLLIWSLLKSPTPRFFTRAEDGPFKSSQWNLSKDPHIPGRIIRGAHSQKDGLALLGK